MAKTARRQRGGRHRCYWENICGAGQTQTYTIEDELNIDAGKHVLAMFLN